MSGDTNGKRREYMSRAELITEIERAEAEVERLTDAISWGVSCVRCSNQLAEDWEIVGGSFICGECNEMEDE